MAKTKRASAKKARQGGKLGVWVVGVHGGLATTMIVGARMIARGLASANGLVTETPGFAGIPVADLDDLVFGGHDVRDATMMENALEIHRENGTIPYEALVQLQDELEEVDGRIRDGSVANCGTTIKRLASARMRRKKRDLATALADIEADLKAFKKDNDLRDVVVVNLASTEPPLKLIKEHQTPTGYARLIKENRRDAVRASGLYSWAALRCGFAFLNFTPSNACILPAHIKYAKKRGLPIMGNDGKTGETLVKSALAPMFKYRNFKVLTWQGYNILGDRDGQVLADSANKASKISTKDGVLSHILGYPLNTHVSIEYAPSLSDLKTAWDFIHFEGFLDYKMSLQFTWQGCDAILAAPIVLDMVRLADFARRKEESGLMTQLSCFFKGPLGVDEHDLHFQFHHLMSYVEGHSKG